MHSHIPEYDTARHLGIPSHIEKPNIVFFLFVNDVNALAGIPLNMAVAHHAVGNAMTSMVGFKVDACRRSGSTGIDQHTILDEQVLCAAHADALAVVVGATAFADYDILSHPSQADSVAARLRERHVLYFDAHRPEKRMA